MNDDGPSVAGAPPADLDAFLGTPPRRPWYRRPSWIAGGLGILLLLWFLSRFFGGADEAGYATLPASRGDLQVTVSATGNVQPTNKVEVGSEQSGLIEQVLVDNNDRVSKGQPLARLDPSRLRDTLTQAQAGLAAANAQVASAQASLAQASANLGRLEQVYRLSGGRVPAKTELDTGRAEYRRQQAAVRAAAAQVLQARAQLATAQTNLGKATIYSPVTGVVLSRSIDPGQTVAASFQAPVLFTIAEDLSRMKLEVKVDEADVGQVRAGQHATFTVDAYPGRTFVATIQRVDVGANASDGATASSANSVVSYTAVLTVDNPDLALRPGMTATADIVTMEKKNALLVPNAALRFSPDRGGAGAPGGVTGVLIPRGPRRGGNAAKQATIGRGSRQTLYVLGGDGKPKPVQVVVGDTNGALTEVTAGGLKPGDQVITGKLAAGAASGRRPATRRGGGAA
jgi:HlyD family secretion protein